MDIYEPNEDVRDPEAEAKMREGCGSDDKLFDPWFPDAQAALDFPEGESVPEGMTYEEWKEARS